MRFSATIANALWGASNLPAYLHFRRALHAPRAAQEQKLQEYLRRNAQTAFGKAHRFETIRSADEFARNVPLADHESFVPWIERVRHGGQNVLTHEPVTRLVPTSGSTGARKLVPFTPTLQREFNVAIAPWLVDLQRQWPTLINGPAYWSITPSLNHAAMEESAVPIGFDTDTEYLGGARRWLAEAVMAVPPDVQKAKSIEALRHETLLHLLRCRELRLISVWHPSFLTLLLDAIPALWPALLDDIENGRNGLFAPSRRRADELRGIGPHNAKMFWPRLRLISCWGDGHAETAIEGLHPRFTEVTIQRKGLLATEAAVTIPFAGRHPLAVHSHFFEFVDDHGQIHLADELREGAEYEVVVTTGGGFYRCRLHDVVRVNGFVGKTPSLQFLGRTGGVSDRFGEKLSETFVTSAIRKATENIQSPKLMFLAPDEGPFGFHYTLYLEGETDPELATRLDILLRQNPHYDWCRELGQLHALRVFQIRAAGFESYVQRECANGKRIGDVKPQSLSTRNGWTQNFQGDYL